MLLPFLGLEKADGDIGKTWWDGEFVKREHWRAGGAGGGHIIGLRGAALDGPAQGSGALGSHLHIPLENM